MVSSELWFGAEAGFYNSVATQSLRFDDGSSAYLTRTPSSASNRDLWTLSLWVKRSSVGTSGTQSLYGVYADGNNQETLAFDSGGNVDKLYWQLYQGGSAVGQLTTNRLFRDVSSWYHIVIAYDSANSTAGNRMRMYINGVEETSFATDTNPSSGLDSQWNSTTAHTIGRINTTNYFDGYIAEVNSVDGQALDPTYFGETKNGVWIPKKYSGSYGTNGFRLQFINTTVTGSGSSSTIGADTSGQNNHFTSSAIVASDCNMPDSPENNWATLNSIYNPKNNPPTFSEGNLKATASQVAYQNTFSTIGVSSGKWYVEMKQNGTTNSANFIGIVDEEAFDDFQDHSHYIGSATVEGVNYGYYMHSGNKYVDGASSSYGSRTNDGEIIGIALDLDNGKLYFSVDGTFVASGDPVNGTNFMAENIPSSTYFFGTTLYQNGYTSGVWNFGQDSSFGGTETATSNSDVNGNGTFHTAPPSGYLALCSANLPDTTISPNADTQADDHFDTLLYTGNQSNNHSITGVSFQPDWIWGKHRDGTNSHQLIDSTRGVTHNLKADVFDPEGTSTTILASFDAPSSIGATDGGFTLNQSGGLNKNTDGFVAWLWLANGTTPTKTYKVKVVADSTDYGHGTGSNKYQFLKSDGTTGFGTNGVDIDLQEGGTYIFDWSDSTAQSHPIRFSLTNDGTHSSGTSAGSEYTTGVVKDDSAYTTTITVASGVANLYYYCQNHSGMGAEIRTNTTHGSTNFDGSILSVSNANTLAGFSIVTYEIDSSGAKTIGHGLTQAPQLIINKGRDQNSSWWTFTTVIDGTLDYVRLNDVTVKADDSLLSLPTSTTFGMIENYSLQQNAVAYCFHSVEGYSKIGTYTSNNSSTDNTFVYTGFRPAFLIVKMTPSSTEWVMMDNKKSSSGGGNPIDKGQYPNYDYAEYSGNKVDFLSNGFKVRDTSGVGYSTRVVLYIAIAEVPFKYANAR